MWNWLKKEFREILPVWAFFFIAFGLHALTLSAVSKEYHIDMYQPFEYLIGSLLLAKVVVLLDFFLEREWFLRDRPLIYTTLASTLIYFVGALFLHYFEQSFNLMRRQHLTLVQANLEIIRPMAEPWYLATMAWLIIVIFGFCTIRELIRAIGHDRFIKMFVEKRGSRPYKTDMDSPANAA